MMMMAAVRSLITDATVPPCPQCCHVQQPSNSMLCNKLVLLKLKKIITFLFISYLCKGTTHNTCTSFTHVPCAWLCLSCCWLHGAAAASGQFRPVISSGNPSSTFDLHFFAAAAEVGWAVMGCYYRYRRWLKRKPCWGCFHMSQKTKVMMINCPL